MNTSVRTAIFFIAFFLCSSFLSNQCRAEEDSTIEFVRKCLADAGMKNTAQLDIDFHERSLSVVYKVTDEGKALFWAKSRSYSISSGGYFPKIINGPFSTKAYTQGQIRRKYSRKLIQDINSASGTTLLVPYYPFDEEQTVWEYFTGVEPDIPSSYLRNNVMTLWVNVDGEANPYYQSKYKWNPCAYSVEVIKELAQLLYKISKAGDQVLNATQDRLALETLLAHEYKEPVDFENLTRSLLVSFGLGSFSLERALEEAKKPQSSMRQALYKKAQLQLKEIKKNTIVLAHQLGVSESTTLEDLAKKFLDQADPTFRSALVKHEKELETIPFLHALFSAEREGIWPQKTIFLGRRIAQLIMAAQIASDICEDNASSLCHLLQQLDDLKTHYLYVKNAPKGVIHGNAHPCQFLLTKDKQWVLADNDNVSVGFFLGDISVDYVAKIVRGYSKGTVNEEEALDLLQAVLIPEWVEEQHRAKVLSYPIVAFAKEAYNLVYAYSLSQENAGKINLTLPPKEFIEGLGERFAYDQLYREQLYKKIPKEKVVPQQS